MPDEPGCWVVFCWDDPYHIYGIFPGEQELRARRLAEHMYGQTAYVRYGWQFIQELQGKRQTECLF